MLTERQEEILDFIREYQSTHSLPPSSRDIAAGLGFSQTAAVQHLRKLSDKGHISQFENASWGLKVLQVQGHLFDAPIYGSIPAGIAAMKEQDPEGTICFDPSFFGVRKPKEGHFWCLRVTGDSMNGAGILDGDVIALVRCEPKPGDIIAALVDETTVTLKRLVKERGRMLLRAANPKYSDIKPDRIESQGVMVGLIRRNAS